MSYRGSGKGKSNSSNAKSRNPHSPTPTNGSWKARQHPEQSQSHDQHQKASSSKFQNPGFSYNGRTWVPQVGSDRKPNLINIGENDIDTTFFTKDELNHFLQDSLSQRQQFISKTELQIRNLRNVIDQKTSGIGEAGQQMANILKFLDMLEKNELQFKSESDGSSDTGRASSSLANIPPIFQQDFVPVNGYQNMHIPYQQPVMTPIEQQVPSASYAYRSYAQPFENMQPEYYHASAHVNDNGGYYNPYQQASPSHMQQQVPYQNDFPETGNWADTKTYQNYSQNARIQNVQSPAPFFPGPTVQNNGHVQNEQWDQKEMNRNAPEVLSNITQIESSVYLPPDNRSPTNNVPSAFENGGGLSELAMETETNPIRKQTFTVPASTKIQLQPPQIIETPPTPINKTNSMSLPNERPTKESIVQTENGAAFGKLMGTRSGTKNAENPEIIDVTSTNANLQAPQIIETPPTPISRGNSGGQDFPEPAAGTENRGEERAFSNSVEPVLEDGTSASGTEIECEKKNDRGTASKPAQADAVPINVHLSSPQIIETPPTPISRENSGGQDFPESATGAENTIESKPAQLDAVPINVHLSSPQIIETPPTPVSRENSEHHVFPEPDSSLTDTRSASNNKELVSDRAPDAEIEVGSNSDDTEGSATGAPESSDGNRKQKSQKKKKPKKVAKQSAVDAIEGLVSDLEREMKIVKINLKIRIQYYLNYQRELRDIRIKREGDGDDFDDGTSISIEDMVNWIIERYENGTFRASNTIENYLENARRFPSLDNFNANNQNQMRKLFFIVLSEMRQEKSFQQTIDEDVSYLSLEKDAYEAQNYFIDVINYIRVIYWRQGINVHMKKHAECRRRDNLPQGSHVIEKELHNAFNENIVTPQFYADSKFFKNRMQHHKDYQKLHPEVAEFVIYYEILDDRDMIREFEQNIRVLNFDIWWLSTLEVELSPEEFDAKEQQYLQMLFL